jgi:hypothetical protein
MIKFKSYALNDLNEGIHDPGTFKAVFMAGAPGSGKDYIMHKSLGGHGLRVIDSDVPFEHGMRKQKLSFTMPSHEEPARAAVRERAKKTVNLKHHLAIQGRNGVVINGTGDNPEKIRKQKEHLESLGYQTHMVMVHTDNDTSRHRNLMRGEKGGRAIPEKIRQQK